MNETPTTGPSAAHPPSLTYYHPNGKGTGTAVRFELRLNRPGETRYDCFFLEMAAQKATAPAARPGRQTASFDWEKKVTVKLGFLDVCELLTVFEGQQPQAGGARNGIYHETDETNTIIALRRETERAGFLLGVSRKTRGGEAVFKGHILLTPAEATGLRCVFQGALFTMAFHTA
jgi:hypothetical protein